MKAPRFGQFLVNNGIVDESAVFEALVIQEARQESISSIAIRKNYLTVRQTMTVYNHLPDTIHCFADLALELEFLNKEKLQKLLDMQRQTRPKLGEILVEMGKMDNRTLEAMLKKFHSMVANAAQYAEVAE